MSLLTLPTEIRIQILEYLPDLAHGRHETIGPNVRLTPAICRVSRVLREDAIQLYAKTSVFIIQTDDDMHVENSRVRMWLQAMGTNGLREVQTLQLSRHWMLTQPSRWQGHVGFYVRLQQHDRIWHCTVGTYPIANDMRGMRLESVQLLRDIVTHRLRLSSTPKEQGLSRADVEFVVEAMNVVASHPIPTFDTEQSDAGKRRRRDVWSTITRKLFTLAAWPDNEVSVTKISTSYTPC